MVSWNYRIILHDDNKEPWYAIHEVYYDEDDNITNFSCDPMHPLGETKGELIQDIKYMLKDARKYPTLLLSHLERELNGEVSTEADRY